MFTCACQAALKKAVSTRIILQRYLNGCEEMSAEIESSQDEIYKARLVCEVSDVSITLFKCGVFKV